MIQLQPSKQLHAPRPLLADNAYAHTQVETGVNGDQEKRFEEKLYCAPYEKPLRPLFMKEKAQLMKQEVQL